LRMTYLRLRTPCVVASSKHRHPSSSSRNSLDRSGSGCAGKYPPDYRNFT
jgi:hypothetical protein